MLEFFGFPKKKASVASNCPKPTVFTGDYKTTSSLHIVEIVPVVGTVSVSKLYILSPNNLTTSSVVAYNCGVRSLVSPSRSKNRLLEVIISKNDRTIVRIVNNVSSIEDEGSLAQNLLPDRNVIIITKADKLD